MKLHAYRRHNHFLNNGTFNYNCIAYELINKCIFVSVMSSSLRTNSFVCFLIKCFGSMRFFIF